MIPVPFAKLVTVHVGALDPRAEVRRFGELGVPGKHMKGRGHGALSALSGAQVRVAAALLGSV